MHEKNHSKRSLQRDSKMYKVDWKFKPFIYLIDLLGYALIKPFLRKELPKNIKKILIIRIDEIGDAILTTPVFRALKIKFPQAEISTLIKPLTKPVYENNPNIDKIITTHSWLNTWSGKKASIRDFIKLIKNLKKENFDLTLELHTDPRNILLASLTSKFTIGCTHRGLGFLLNKKISSSNKHIIAQCLDIARIVGAVDSPDLELQLTKEAVKSIRKKLKNHGFKLTKPQKLICINPGAGRKNKLWFNHYWADLIQAILKKRNTYVVLTGTQNESKNIEEILNLITNKSRIINLCNQTSLQELFALVFHSSLVIAPDSTIIHASKALSVPSIGLYGPTDPFIWGYNEKMHKSIFRKLDCSFCDKATCKFNISKCMEYISPKDVLREIESFYG